MTLTPAYGRDYKFKAAAVKDWANGKDFIINDITSQWDGKPTSIRDWPPEDVVYLRYYKLRKVARVTPKEVKAAMVPPEPICEHSNEQCHLEQMTHPSFYCIDHPRPMTVGALLAHKAGRV